MKLLLTLFLTLSMSLAFGQESNNGKELWATSFLNKKAPELVVGEWLSKIPDTKGKFVLIDFWATWCGPCLRAIPELNTLAKEFSKDLVVIGISDENADKVKSKADKTKIEYYCAIDTCAVTKSALAVTGIPHLILIDPKGIVRWEGFPFLKGHELTKEKVAEIIKKYK